jgi:Protein of unknown function (DUF2817)
VELTAAFSGDYWTARDRFRDAVTRLAWELEAHEIDAAGPNGERLTIDVAVSPGDGSGKAIVVSGGLHGVEGFFGSAVQLALLENWISRTATGPPMRCVFLHGLNPFGFAWLRRFDENSVDPNRNFLLDGETYIGSPPAYADLDKLLNPARPPSRWEAFALRAVWAIARYGMPALKQAIASGQYEFPKGLFYGGAGPTQATRLLGKRLGHWLENCREVVHFDFHTGLGKWGECKLLLDYGPTEEQRERLTKWFGQGSFEACDPTGVSYAARGGFGRWCVNRHADRDYLYACAEFGTYGPIQMLRALRAENQAHHWGKPGDPLSQRAKQRLKEVFCPSSPQWRRRVLERSVGLVEAAVTGMRALNVT